MCSTILAVGSQAIAADFALENIYMPALPVAMYVLGLGLGPLFLAPLSELHGRRIVYLLSFSLFTVINIGCALAPSIAVLSCLRFLAGVCGSAGPTLGAASIGDMFVRNERGKAQSLYALGPTAGPVLAPLVGAFVADRTHGWRWLMWVMVIASALTVILCLMFLKETYVPFLLRKRAKKVWKSSSRPDDRNRETQISTRSLFVCAMKRPLQLLFFSPICTVMSFYMAL